LTEEYKHLAERGQAYVGAANGERVDMILRDIWINCPRFKHILQYAENLSRYREAVPAACMIIYGEGGSGKSSLIGQIIRKSAKLPGRIASLSLVNNPGGLRFSELILHGLGIPLSGGRNGKLLLPADVAKYIRQQDVRILIIDELHAALCATKTEQIKNLGHLKALSNDPARLSIIGVGTLEAASALSYDQQMERRYEAFSLERWDLDDEFRNFLVSWEQNLPLRKPSAMHEDDIARYILDKSRGVMDDVVKCVKWAAVQAILTGEERITREMIDRGWSIKLGFTLES